MVSHAKNRIVEVKNGVVAISNVGASRSVGDVTVSIKKAIGIIAHVNDHPNRRYAHVPTQDSLSTRRRAFSFVAHSMFKLRQARLIWVHQKQRMMRYVRKACLEIHALILDLRLKSRYTGM
jgi:hypothetical protein